jgi:hypothetical protein
MPLGVRPFRPGELVETLVDGKMDPAFMVRINVRMRRPASEEIPELYRRRY